MVIGYLLTDPVIDDNSNNEVDTPQTGTTYEELRRMNRSKYRGRQANDPGQL